MWLQLHFAPLFRAGSSSVVQMTCSLGLGLFLSRLYQEHFRYGWTLGFTKSYSILVLCYVRIPQNCFHFNSEPKDNKAQWVVIIAFIRIYLLHAYLMLQTLVVWNSWNYRFFAEKSHFLAKEYINADDVIAFCLYLMDRSLKVMLHGTICNLKWWMALSKRLIVG